MPSIDLKATFQGNTMTLEMSSATTMRYAALRFMDEIGIDVSRFDGRFIHFNEPVGEDSIAWDWRFDNLILMVRRR